MMLQPLSAGILFAAKGKTRKPTPMSEASDALSAAISFVAGLQASVLPRPANGDIQLVIDASRIGDLNTMLKSQTGWELRKGNMRGKYVLANEQTGERVNVSLGRTGDGPRKYRK